MSDLDGQVALVTGGAQGIGLRVARRLADAGAPVMVADVDPDRLEAAVADDPRLHGIVTDVTDATSTEAAFAACADRLGVPTAVVVNAGVLDMAPALAFDEQRFRRVLDVNLTGAYITARAAARRLVDARTAGSIVLMGSLAGVRGIAGNAAYAASKFGVVGLAQVLANDLAPHGIRVNCVSPGQIDTDMLATAVRAKAAAQGVTEAEVNAQIDASIPLGRLGSPDDVAEAVLWLASPRSGYVTGHNLVVDGGWLVK